MAAVGFLVATSLYPAPPSLAGQQRFAVDHEAGREVVNDWTRAFLSHVFEVDHARGVVYVAEVGEPELVVGFSLADGTVVGRYGRGPGDGPGEMRQMVQDVAAADGGLFVTDGSRVHYWSADGDSVWTWRPASAFAAGLCAIGDDPVLPLSGGALRGREGARLGSDGRQVGSVSDRVSLRSAEAACIGNTAYFAVEDALIGHSTDGESVNVPVPREVSDGIADWRASRPDGGRYASSYRSLSHDGRGRLVLTLPSHMRLGFSAAIIDPATGCYDLVLDEPSNVHRWVMGVHADSALVYERGVSVREINGRRTRVVDSEAFMIAVRPLRPAGGEPCAPPAGKSWLSQPLPRARQAPGAFEAAVAMRYSRAFSLSPCSTAPSSSSPCVRA